MMEFHISRRARDLYKFDESLISLSGSVIPAGFHASRVFALKMNRRRDLLRFPETAVKAGQINAMGLIHEILHFVVQRFQSEISPEAMERALRYVEERVGGEELERTLLQFADQFPPVAVYRARTSAKTWLKGSTAGVSHRRLAAEEFAELDRDPWTLYRQRMVYPAAVASGAMTPSPGPSWQAKAGRVWHTGAAAGGQFISGSRAGRVFSSGQTAGRIHG